MVNPSCLIYLECHGEYEQLTLIDPLIHCFLSFTILISLQIDSCLLGAKEIYIFFLLVGGGGGGV